MTIHDLYIKQMKRNTARNTARRAAANDIVSAIRNNPDAFKNQFITAYNAAKSGANSGDSLHHYLYYSSDKMNFFTYASEWRRLQAPDNGLLILIDDFIGGGVASSGYCGESDIDQFPDIETEWRHFISRIEHLMRW